MKDQVSKFKNCSIMASNAKDHDSSGSDSSPHKVDIIMRKLDMKRIKRKLS